MAEKWSKSESIAQLVTALAEAQLKFDPVLKDSDNPAYRSKYADLQSVISATMPHLASFGLSVIQMPHAEFGVDDAKMLTLTTLLAHKSGEWISSDLTLPAMMRERFDAQSVGSAITYGRRYALQAMLGVAAEIDDDGNRAAGVGSKEVAQAVGKQKASEVKAKVKNPQEGIMLVPFGENTVVLAGNGVSIARAQMNEEQKSKYHIRFNDVARGFTLPLSEALPFQSMCEKFGIECLFSDAQV
jgi:hypothetical protein